MSTPQVLLHNTRLIDGTGDNAIEDAAVLIDDGRLAWAGPANELPTNSAPRRVDLNGRTICPGFIDAHVHFALPGSSGSPIAGVLQTPSYRILAVLDRLKITIENGVTTARDLLGLDAGIRQAVEEHRIVSPRLRVAISMLSQRGGHSDFTAPSGIDGLEIAVAFPGSPPNLVNSVDDMRLRVRELVAAGADCIKLASSGGISSPHDQPDWLCLRPEMIKAAVEEAHNYGGLPVSVHAMGEPGITAAVHSGVTSIEHGYALNQELHRDMVDQGQFLVPTLLETMHDLDPKRMAPAAYQKSVRWHRIAQEAFGSSAESGIKIAMGTDSGLTADHGNNLKELALLCKFSGMSPMDAIVAGTRHAAELLDIADITGTVEAGKAADLVITDVNPLTDLEHLGDPTHIHAVVKDGRVVIDRAGVFPRGTLSPLVALAVTMFH